MWTLGKGREKRSADSVEVNKDYSVNVARNSSPSDVGLIKIQWHSTRRSESTRIVNKDALLWRLKLGYKNFYIHGW